MKPLPAGNIFERQQTSHNRARRLGLQFALLTIPNWIAFFCMCLMISATAFDLRVFFTGGYTFFEALRRGASPESVGFFAFLAILSTAIIAVLVFVKKGDLMRSATRVPVQLGCVGMGPPLDDVKLKRLTNSLQEIALAAGIPPPSLYLWPTETAINSLAVGRNVADASILVTTGAVDALTRDELQALLAHGVAQIVNGDLELNTQLAAYLYAFYEPLRFSRDMLGIIKVRDRHGQGALFCLWLILLVPGLLLGAISLPGFWAARLFQRSIARERKLLADATALQFTRNGDALKSLLVKISAIGSCSRSFDATLEDFEHACFAAPAMRRGIAIHPTPEQRIAALGLRVDRSEVTNARRAAGFNTWDLRVEKFGEERPKPGANNGAWTGKDQPPRSSSLSRLATMLAPGPQVEEPVSVAPGEIERADDARAKLFALVLDRKPTVQELQLSILQTEFTATSILAVRQALGALQPKECSERTMSLDAHLPKLRSLPPPELRRLLRALAAIEQADNSTDVFEYSVSRMASGFISDLTGSKAHHGSMQLDEVTASSTLLFSVLAQQTARGNAAATAYEEGMKRLGNAAWPPYSRHNDWVRPLDRALCQLECLQPLGKQTLLDGLTATASYDRQVTLSERELIRAVSAILHCPMPRSFAS
ncbi:MAG: M48 family metalloprotease [Pseudomonadota bacterium]